MILLFLQLFATFFFIGCLTIGGGGVMIPLIQHHVVNMHGWITEEVFTNIVAISQMTPGPIGINCATYVGYDVIATAGGSNFLGILGSLASTFAIVLPSFIIVLIIVKIYERLCSYTVFKTMLSALKPTIAGLIGAAALVLIFDVEFADKAMHFDILEENFRDISSWVLFATALIVSLKFRANPILTILAGGLVGILIY